jgi:hypothetical protein
MKIMRISNILPIAIILSALAICVFVNNEYNYSTQVDRIQRVLEGRWVYSVPEGGRWVVAIARPCAPKSIEYVRKYGGYILVGYYVLEGTNASDPFDSIHVVVSSEPVEPGSMIFDDDYRLKYNTSLSRHGVPIKITHVFTSNGKLIGSISTQ